jgi:conserved oligomeric Golgi complex subunit 2
VPDFDPATFLASLSNRHQTLEDLRQELRDLSQSLNKELLDLVNENYHAFLSLGATLKGGEEKVEEVRVGLLGFQRDITAIQAKVEARQKDMECLLKQKKELKRQANIGRALLDILERIEELEQKLMIGEAAKLRPDMIEGSDSGFDLFDSDSDGSDADGLNSVAVISLGRLEHHIQKYACIMAISERLGRDHPFLISQQPRIEKIKATLLFDLKAALEQVNSAAERRDGRILKVLHLYDLLGETAGAVSALQRLKI